MKRYIAPCITALLLLAVGCSADRQENSAPLVVTSFTIIQDLADMVGGERTDIRSLSPAGAEVHEWELVPQNFADIENAALILYNGWDIEQWLPQVEAAATAGTPLIPVAERIESAPLPIRIGDLSGTPDPHMWMDPRLAAEYLNVIRDELIGIDPEGAELYRRNTEEAQAQLSALYEEMQTELSPIPADRRVLVSSEAAFQYFAAAFDFSANAIWGSNTEGEGSPRQLARITGIIRDNSIPVVFYESTTGDRHARNVASETGIGTAGPLYTDSLGTSPEGTDSYIAMQRHNVRLLTEHLAGAADQETPE